MTSLAAGPMSFALETEGFAHGHQVSVARITIRIHTGRLSVRCVSIGNGPSCVKLMFFLLDSQFRNLIGSEL